ncbi:MAG: hypothetical protein AB2660_06050 [Candidatus Thiodiazotropha sp.]
MKQPNGIWRVLVISLVHGLAGSAALVILTVTTTETLWQGIADTALFGLGSMAGMAVLLVVIAVPFRYTACRLTWVHNGLLGIVGLLTVLIGATIFINSGIEVGLNA